MTNETRPQVRCAIYTRKSTEDGLEMEYNSLDAQREACEAYITSQKHEGWVGLPHAYNDGGYTGANTERPALQRLLADIQAGKVDVVVTYKLDRLSRSLLDFVKLIEMFDEHKVSFVSVTQCFDTRTSMGRLTMHILLSFAQFEREMIGERVRDKIAGAKRKGMFTGGTPVLGYDIDPQTHKLVVDPAEAKLVRYIFKRYIEVGSGQSVARNLNSRGITAKSWTNKAGVRRVGKPWNGSGIYRLISNKTYLGLTLHKGTAYPGEHEAIVSQALWDRAHAVLTHDGYVKRRKEESVPALLKGILRCGHCESPMFNSFTRRKGRVYRYYVCHKASKHGYDTCDVRSMSAGELDQAVVDQLRVLFRTPEMIAQTYRAAKELQLDEITSLKMEKAELDVQLGKLQEQAVALAANGDAPSDELVRLKREMDEVLARITQIDDEVLTIQSQSIDEQDVAQALRTLDPIWEELFPAEQRRIVQLLVEQVILRPGNIDIHYKTDGLHTLMAELNDTSDSRSRA
ncbi:MAG: recombinase family protein [Armatimonadetes bacterium]|nr:recombinase family protein [Armatimonadota bacterium]